LEVKAKGLMTHYISGGTEGELYEKFSFNISPFGKGGLRGIL
jgi:hypothetical protein